MSIFFRFLFFALILLVSILNVYAIDDDYKPYLHRASVPEHPKLDLYSIYKTNIFSGGATYSYDIEVSKGTNSLSPRLSVNYNSQAAKQNPSIMGSGWLLTQNYIYRDVNSTLNDTSDDIFKLILNSVPHEFVYSNGQYQTKIESYMRIENISDYWLITLKDGTKYRFGYDDGSNLGSNMGYNYSVRWSLDLVNDTHGNSIYYSYSENPNGKDLGAAYLDSITYNNNQERRIAFDYESAERPDKRIVYDNANKLYMSRRIENINVYADNILVRRYKFNYTSLNPESSMASLSSISQYGSDDASVLHTISFEYHEAKEGYTRHNNSFIPEELFSNWEHIDYGVRLLDVNNDGYVDIVKARTSGSDKKTFLNNKTNNWTNSSSYLMPVYIVDGSDYDNGVRFVDLNNDGYVDILQGKSTRKAWLNNGSAWNESTEWQPPIDFMSGASDQGARLVDFNGDGRTDILVARDGIKLAYMNNGTGWTDVSSKWESPAEFLTGGNDQGTRIIDLNGDGMPDIMQANNNVKKSWLNNGSGWVEYGNFNSTVSFVTSSWKDNGVRFADVNGDGLTFRQLIYAVVFVVPALAIFLKSRIGFMFKAVNATILISLAVLFMFFNFSSYLLNIINWLKFREAFYMDKRMKEFIGITEIKDGVIYVSKK